MSSGQRPRIWILSLAVQCGHLKWKGVGAFMPSHKDMLLPQAGQVALVFIVFQHLTLVLRQGGPRAVSMKQGRNPALACSTLVSLHFCGTFVLIFCD